MSIRFTGTQSICARLSFWLGVVTIVLLARILFPVASGHKAGIMLFLYTQFVYGMYASLSLGWLLIIASLIRRERSGFFRYASIGLNSIALIAVVIAYLLARNIYLSQ
ncbi:MAG: hypothetical protein R3301_19035 [Saprospiraceae bacterium]|nr:hypothetical protein [Saprospiraceae bacterium]